MPAGVEGCINIKEAKEICRIMLRPPQQIVPLIRSTPGVGKSDIIEQLAIEMYSEYAKEGCPGCNAKDGPSPNPLDHERGCGAYHSPDHCNICKKKRVVWTDAKVGKVTKRTLAFQPYPAHVKVIDIRLSTFDPIEIKGLPYTNGKVVVNGEEKTLTKWACPEFLPVEDDIYCILFLDEFLNAPPAVQNASLQLIYDHKVHTHKLGDLVSLALAGNTEGDGSYIVRLGGAAKNRVAHLNVEADYEVWVEWARKNDINAEFIGAVEFRPDVFIPSKFNRDADAQSTPRTFTKLACLLAQQGKYSNADIRRLGNPIIGYGETTELIAYINQYEKVKPEEILFEGKMPTFSNDQLSLKFATACSVSNFIHRYAEKISKKEHVANFEKLLELLGPELSIKCLGDLHLQEHAHLALFLLKHSNGDFKAKIQEICEVLTDTAAAA